MESFALSVIIPNWNGSPFLFELFTALFGCGGLDRTEIILVDNGSTDASARMTREFYPAVRTLELGANQGFARAVNRGIQAASGECLAIVNNDISWDRDWLAPGVRFLAENDDYDFAVPLVLNYFRRGLVDSAGDGVNRRFMPYKRWFGHPRRMAEAGPCDLTAASCSAVLFRRRFFERVGAFDEDFFMYYEDADLFFRGLWKGARGRLLPDLEVYHREGGSIRRYEQEHQARLGSGAKARLLVRNRVFFLVKNCPLGYAALAWPLLFLEWVRSFLHHLRRGDGLLFLGAHREALPLLPRMFWKRRLIQKHRQITVRKMIALLRHEPGRVI